MLEKITDHYRNHGEASNLSNLVAAAATSVEIPPEINPDDFRAREGLLLDQFLAFVVARNVVSSGNHPVVARTRRWVRHVNIYTPVHLVSHEEDRDLQAVPFIENPVVDTFSPEASYEPSEKPHYVELALSFLQPHQILRHAVISNPWLSVSSRRVGLVLRANPDFYTDISEK